MAKKEQKKNETKLSFSFIDTPVETIEFNEKSISGREFLFWGNNNQLPNELWNLYLKSSIVSGIINGTCDYISGNGLVINDLLIRFKDAVNKEGDTLDDIIRNIAIDYMIYDGFALQLIYNPLHEITEIYWVDIRKLRLDEDMKKAFYSDKWGGYGQNTAIQYELWQPDFKGKSCIYYFNGHRSRGVYPIPRYSGAVCAIKTSAEIGRFHLMNIKNNLSSGVIISFNNGVPSETEKKLIEEKIKEKFSGSENAGKFIIQFNDSKESETTIQRLQEDSQDKKFEVLSKSIQQEIFISFRATPELFGFSTEGNGFSKEEYLQAFELYNKTVVGPAQKDIIRVFDKIFDVKDSFKFIPFKIYEINQTENE